MTLHNITNCDLTAMIFAIDFREEEREISPALRIFRDYLRRKRSARLIPQDVTVTHAVMDDLVTALSAYGTHVLQETTTDYLQGDLSRPMYDEFWRIVDRMDEIGDSIWDQMIKEGLR